MKTKLIVIFFIACALFGRVIFSRAQSAPAAAAPAINPATVPLQSHERYIAVGGFLVVRGIFEAPSLTGHMPPNFAMITPASTSTVKVYLTTADGKQWLAKTWIQVPTGSAPPLATGRPQFQIGPPFAGLPAAQKGK